MPSPRAARTTCRAHRSSTDRSTRRGSHFVGSSSHSATVAYAVPVVRAQAPSAPRPATAQSRVQRIRRRLDEEHAQRGVATEQARHEVLVAPPHRVPGLERGDDEVHSDHLAIDGGGLGGLVLAA